MKIQLSKADHQAFKSQKLLRYVQELLKVGYGPLTQHSCSQKATTGQGMMLSPVKIHDLCFFFSSLFVSFPFLYSI